MNYQVEEVQILTQSIARRLGKLPIIHSIPRRKRHPRKVQQIDENTYIAPSLKDLVIESLQNIEEEWDELPPSLAEESLTLFPGESGNSLPLTLLGSPRIEQEKPPNPPRILVMDIVGGVGGAATIARFPWLTQDASVVPRVQHDLPNILEKFLPTFDLDKKEDTLEYHINQLVLSL